MIKLIIAPVLAVALLLSGCATVGQFTNTEVITAVAVATSVGLKQVPAAHKAAVISILNIVATDLGTLTSNPTPQQLGDLLTNSIPADIRAQYSEAITFVVPLVVANYQIAYDKYATNQTKLIQVLNDIATGIRSGIIQ
jgi:uncharacterized protein YceK